MSKIIETETSFLLIDDFSDQKELMEKCVDFSIPLLKEKPEIMIFGKICHQQRNIGFFSNESIGYKYSGQLSESIPLNEYLLELLEIINNKFNSNYNGILINEYIDGNNVLGAHSDDESNLDSSGVIAISYGAVRKFRIRDKKTKIKILDIPTKHLSIIQMAGEFQKEFTHEIPKEVKVKERRISFTFRKHLI